MTRAASVNNAITNCFTTFSPLGVVKGNRQNIRLLFHFELPVYQSDQRKSDFTDRTQVPTTGGPASAPALADDMIE